MDEEIRIGEYVECRNTAGSFWIKGLLISIKDGIFTLKHNNGKVKEYTQCRYLAGEKKLTMIVDENAVKGVTDKVRIPTECPYCKSKVELLHHKEHYGKVYSYWPWVYACTNCDASVGVHPNTDIPLGTLADKLLRSKRKQAKEMWQDYCEEHGYNRRNGYRFLAQFMGKTKGETHFGWFTLEECIKILDTMK